jgi:hypothetical protein
MLYRTIAVQYTDAIDGYPIFTWDVLLSAMRSKPPSFFHYAVRNICLLLTDGVKANVETLLGLCTRVHNLSLSSAYGEDDYDSAMPILLAPLPLTHLYGNLRPIFRSLPSTDPLFAHITHLCSRNWLGFDDTEMTSRLSLMPHLTHLSFDFTPFISVCPLVLENCKSLCVLVFLGHPASLWSYREDLAVLRRDIRFVAMLNAWHLKDWQMGTHAGVDYWMRAEDFIAKRRSGEIDGAPPFQI